MFTRRLDKAEANLCVGGQACPAVLEMETGDYAIIGTDVTDIAGLKLPAGCGVAGNERIVSVPRKTMISAWAAMLPNG